MSTKVECLNKISDELFEIMIKLRSLDEEIIEELDK